MKEIKIGILRRHPPLKHHAARARYGQQVTIPSWRSGVGRYCTVVAVILDELCEVGRQRTGR